MTLPVWKSWNGTRISDDHVHSLIEYVRHTLRKQPVAYAMSWGTLILGLNDGGVVQLFECFIKRSTVL